MSDADNFGIRYTNKFTSTYKGIFSTYYRKNTAGGDEFEEFFDLLEEALATDPRLRRSVSVPWPGNFGRPEWDLRKFKFPMPRLRGESGLGRLLYIVDDQKQAIYLLWVYTHHEFSKQPPTKDIKRAAKEIVRHLDN